MTIFNTAITAVIAALSSATPVAPSITRVRLRPLSASTPQAVVVRPLQSQVAESQMLDQMPVSWAMGIAVECYARSLTSSVSPDESVDDLVAAVFARLMQDTTLGGAVLGLQPQEISYDFDVDGEQTACATLVFIARQRSPGFTL